MSEAYKLHQVLKDKYVPIAQPKKRLIFLGAPGSGKGTHSEWLVKDFGLAHYSTGDLLREEVNKKTELGLQAQELMSQGKLVPDEVVLGMIRSRVLGSEAKNGFILDGFPRTNAQAEGLDLMLKENNEEIDGCILFECGEDCLVERVCGRRIHQPSGRTYHVKFSPPKVEGKDDVTGEDLIHRKDDNEETFKKRLAVFQEITSNLKEYYEAQGKLFIVNSEVKKEAIRDLRFMFAA